MGEAVDHGLDTVWWSKAPFWGQTVSKYVKHIAK